MAMMMMMMMMMIYAQEQNEKYIKLYNFICYQIYIVGLSKV
jgi:hypothetical protein